MTNPKDKHLIGEDKKLMNKIPAFAGMTVKIFNFENRLIKKILVNLYGENRAKRIQILYGGSVKDHNADELSKVPGVGGFLVGGASHKPEMVKAIVASLS